jgi:hypothetical protein
MGNKMTAPTEQKGLYDQLEDCCDDDMRVVKVDNYIAIIENFEQRLADAESSGQTAAIAYGAELRKNQLLSEQLASANQEARDQTNIACEALAELERVREVLSIISDPDNFPAYHSQGMGCGLEDRNITDRYEAMRYGWDSLADRVQDELIIHAVEALETAATQQEPAKFACDYQGIHFGATYEDATCIDGYLWDLDSCDEPGGGLRYGGDIPCPKCNAEEYAAYYSNDEQEPAP